MTWLEEAQRITQEATQMAEWNRDEAEIRRDDAHPSTLRALTETAAMLDSFAATITTLLNAVKHLPFLLSVAASGERLSDEAVAEMRADVAAVRDALPAKEPA